MLLRQRKQETILQVDRRKEEEREVRCAVKIRKRNNSSKLKKKKQKSRDVMSCWVLFASATYI